MTLRIDDRSAALYSVGQAAEMLDVQQAFLRRLDAFDVVTPARSTGDQRRYSRADLERVQAVQVMVEDGFSLISIRRVLELQAEVAALHLVIEELTRLGAR